MSEVWKVHPVSILFSSTLEVKLSVVLENTSLLDVPVVVGGLLGGGVGTNLLVLSLGQTGGDVRLLGEGTSLNVLLSAGTVVVRIGDWSPKVEVGNGFEEAVQFGGLGSLGGRGEGRGGGHGGGDEESGGLHDVCVGVFR